VIPQDQYGAGPVIQWDRGHWIPRGDPREGYAKGHLKFSLRGKKLGGDWNLVRVHPKASERGDNWLLIKAADGARGPGTNVIFWNYLRNGRGSTAVAAYSTRARLEAGVAMPPDWGEFDAIGSAAHFTLANASRRLNGLGCDPWQAIDTTKQRLRAKRSRAPRRSV
jgi:hypothetical protein